MSTAPKRGRKEPPTGTKVLEIPRSSAPVRIALTPELRMEAAEYAAQLDRSLAVDPAESLEVLIRFALLAGLKRMRRDGVHAVANEMLREAIGGEVSGEVTPPAGGGIVVQFPTPPRQ